MSFGPVTNAVYKWEREFVQPLDRGALSLEAIQGVVRYVWFKYGLSHPPKVIRSNSKRWSYGNRLELAFSPNATTTTVLHELCHALDSSAENDVGIQDESTRRHYEEDAHGPNWLGLYVNALDQFMPQPEFRKLYLMGELHRRGLKMSLAPKLRLLGL